MSGLVESEAETFVQQLREFGKCADDLGAEYKILPD